MDNQPGPSISGFKLPIKIGSKSLMIIGVIVILIVAGLGFWFWQKKPEVSSPKSGPKSAEQQKQQEEKLQENVGDGLGANIYEKSQNPIVDKLSETNPFGKAPINPLKDIYANPFE